MNTENADKPKEIRNVHDSFFHKIFDDPKNAVDFLKRVLPAGLLKHLDLTHIAIEDTKYVSNQFERAFSDIVVKAAIKTKKGKKKPIDIYFLVEHKTIGRVEIFIQVLKYMVFEWEKDYNNKKVPRVIIPVVFYHGENKWKVPHSFAEQLDIDEDVKPFILDFRYLLFDTNDWDFRDESNAEIRKNVFVFTAMVLMKTAYREDMEAIRETFKLWHEMGLIKKTDVIIFFMEYVIRTNEISRDNLNKMLDESQINGGDIMPTLAQQMKEEFKEEFMHTIGPQLKKEGEKRGEKRGVKIGRKEEKLETAKRMLNSGVKVEDVIKYTGLTKKDIKSLIN